jgi:hypothetical protein
MPSQSTSEPPMMIESVKPQKAGLSMAPICSFVMWKSTVRASTMSPRIENTMDVVRRARQLAAKSLRVFMEQTSRVGRIWPGA